MGKDELLLSLSFCLRILASIRILSGDIFNASLERNLKWYKSDSVSWSKKKRSVQKQKIKEFCATTAAREANLFAKELRKRCYSRVILFFCHSFASVIKKAFYSYLAIWWNRSNVFKYGLHWNREHNISACSIDIVGGNYCTEPNRGLRATATNQLNAPSDKQPSAVHLAFAFGPKISFTRTLSK